MHNNEVLTETARCGRCPIGGATVVQLAPDWSPVAQLVPGVAVECTDGTVDARLRAETQPGVGRGYQQRACHRYRHTDTPTDTRPSLSAV